MYIQNWVKNTVHLGTLMIRTENMRISVLEDNTAGFNICQGKQNETNANSGSRNLVSCQASTKDKIRFTIKDTGSS